MLPTFELRPGTGSVARRTASAEWAAGLALDGRAATLLGFGLTEGLGLTLQRRGEGLVNHERKVDDASNL